MRDRLIHRGPDNGRSLMSEFIIFWNHTLIRIIQN